jgi:hypothetical protein
MKKSAKAKPNITISLTKKIESEYDWSGKAGAILLKETKDLIKAFESLNYTEKQIIKELQKNGNI